MNGKLVVACGLVTLVTQVGALQAQQGDAGQLYARNCASCHGTTGTPNPAMVRSMGAIPDFAEPRALAARPDSVLIGAVTAGKGRNMPAYRSRLTPEQIRALVAFLRTLGRRQAP
ncbi:MAG: cytochrome c [Gemmatimonadetes bacterium]|nr:cytochrome c [Gemmatimonadota bacterium]